MHAAACLLGCTCIAIICISTMSHSQSTMTTLSMYLLIALHNFDLHDRTTLYCFRYQMMRVDVYYYYSIIIAIYKDCSGIIQNKAHGDYFHFSKDVLQIIRIYHPIQVYTNRKHRYYEEFHATRHCYTHQLA
jgi:hypothetical protein